MLSGILVHAVEHKDENAHDPLSFIKWFGTHLSRAWFVVRLLHAYRYDFSVHKSLRFLHASQYIASNDLNLNKSSNNI